MSKSSHIEEQYDTSSDHDEQVHNAIDQAEGYGGGIWEKDVWTKLRRIRYRFREPLAEMIGTACITFFGPAVGCLTSFTGTGGNDWMAITIGWGLAVMLGAYSSDASGAHLNPAVTLTLAIFEGFPMEKVPIYFLAQLIGGFLGAGLCLLLNYNLITAFNKAGGGLGECVVNPAVDFIAGVGPDTSGAFVTWKHPNITLTDAFFIEATLTAFLLFGILNITNSRFSRVNGLGPFLVGVLVILIGTTFGAQTGYAINPARDLGPRMAIATCHGVDVFTRDRSYFWIPIIAPLVGGPIGGMIFYMTSDSS